MAYDLDEDEISMSGGTSGPGKPHGESVQYLNMRSTSFSLHHIRHWSHLPKLSRLCHITTCCTKAVSQVIQSAAMWLRF